MIATKILAFAFFVGACQGQSCDTDSDCDPGQFCDVMNGDRCILLNAQAQRLLGASSPKVGCTYDHECDLGEFCDGTNDRCEFMSNRVGAAGPNLKEWGDYCNWENPCPDGESCAADHYCYPDCIGYPFDCSGTQKMLGSSPTIHCRSTQDCNPNGPADMYCDMNDHTCKSVIPQDVIHHVSGYMGICGYEDHGAGTYTCLAGLYCWGETSDAYGSCQLDGDATKGARAKTLGAGKGPGKGQVSTVDVQAKFYRWALGYCGAGNLKNADIGNGNLVGTDAMKSHQSKRFLRHQSTNVGQHRRDWANRVTQAGAAMARKSKDQLMASGLRPGVGASTDNLGGCDFSTDCASNGGYFHWCGTPYKCMSRYAGLNGAVRYGHPNKHPAAPETYEIFIDNDTPKDTQAQVTRSFDTSNTAAISAKQSVKIGRSLHVDGSFELVKAGGNLSWNMDLSKSTTTTVSTRDTFNFADPVPVMAKSTTMVQFTTTKEKISGTWEADISLPYYGKIWCDHKVQGHWEWFVPACVFMGDGICTDDQIQHPDAQYFAPASGVFTGGIGVEINAEFHTCKLGAKSKRNCHQKSHPLPTNQ